MIFRSAQVKQIACEEEDEEEEEAGEEEGKLGSRWKTKTGLILKVLASERAS